MCNLTYYGHAIGKQVVIQVAIVSSFVKTKEYAKEMNPNSNSNIPS
jgi:hypothetical protein